VILGHLVYVHRIFEPLSLGLFAVQGTFLYNKSAVLQYSAVTASESGSLEIIIRSFAGHGLQKSDCDF